MVHDIDKAPVDGADVDFIAMEYVDVTIAVLMVNGRYDFELPLEASQKPFFRLLGTAEKDKRHVLFESGHGGYPMKELIKELLDWLDRYLRPVGEG